MDLDTHKIDNAVLALLALNVHDENEYGARSWKSFDWDALDRLHDRGLIGDPKSKAKSVVMTPEGLAQSRKLLAQLFGSSK